MSTVDPALVFTNVRTPEALYTLLVDDDSGTLQSLYCSLNDTALSMCGGICPNTDIAGAGVRAAFYAQAICNVFLVWYSPDDSAASQWAAVVLTLALIIPALIQKHSNSLTLFHATVVLNFATLSTLASLAVAPWCTVWRAVDAKESKIKKEERGRVLLSLALIIQIIIQWVWAIVMFTMPQYAQPSCNATTLLLFFGRPLNASSIDTGLLSPDDPAQDHKGYFYIWPLWLLFSITLTMAYFIILAISSGSSLLPTPAASNRHTPWETQQSNTPRQHSRSRSRMRNGSVSRSQSLSRPPLNLSVTSALPKNSFWRRLLSRLSKHFRPLLRHGPHLPQSRSAVWLLSHNTFAIIFFVFLVVITEVQHARNPWLLPGENNTEGFGQVAAILLAVVPLWSIGMAWFRGKSSTAAESLPMSLQQTRQARDMLRAILPSVQEQEEEGARTPASPRALAPPVPPSTPPRMPRGRTVRVQSPATTSPAQASPESLKPTLVDVDVSYPLILSWLADDEEHMENIPLTTL